MGPQKREHSRCAQNETEGAGVKPLLPGSAGPSAFRAVGGGRTRQGKARQVSSRSLEVLIRPTRAFYIFFV
jgi:hypothetical protein